MPHRITPLVTGQIYHVYNRGSEKRRIFEDRRDYQRFLKLIQYYQLEGPKPRYSHFSSFSLIKPDVDKKIVGIVAYCLMPNHFHLMPKPLKNLGITEFMSKLSNSYTKYYNIRHKRVGPLFQGEFKSVLVESDEQLIHLSRYIHLNPYVSFIVKNLESYEWSSYMEYINQNPNQICSKNIVTDFFENIEKYQSFILDYATYAQNLEIIKHQLIDED